MAEVLGERCEVQGGRGEVHGGRREVQGEVCEVQGGRGEVLEELYQRFPGLLLVDTAFRHFSLACEVRGRPVLLYLSTPSFPSPRGATVRCGEGVLGEQEEQEVEEVCRSSDTMVHLLERILGILQGAPPCTPPLTARGVGRVAAVMEVLQEVGWDRVASLSEDLSTAELSTLDSMDHTHLLQVTFPPDFPTSPPSSSHGLPPCTWEPPSSSSLPLLVTSWLSAVSSLAPTWQALREVDRLCWVVHPDPPLPCHLHRRLVVMPSVTLQISLHPASPSSLPSLAFLGPQTRVEPLRARLQEHVELWEEDDPLLTNLERLLGLELPGKPQEEEVEEWRVECGVCYTYRLGEELPATACEDSRCGRPFHQSCLYQCLEGQPGVRSSLAEVWGECPYCSKPISCAKPED